MPASPDGISWLNQHICCPLSQLSSLPPASWRPADWQDHGLIFARFDGTPWRPSFVYRRFRQLAAQAGVPVVTLHEGGRHTGVSLMHDAEVRDDIRMREAGHADRAVHARYNHVLDEAHRAAAEQVAALVAKAGAGHELGLHPLQ
jgi:integrase